MEQNWKKNAKHDLEIQGYTAQGAGVARLSGRVVFVPHTLRGEVWQVSLVKVTKSYAYGRGLHCLQPSPQRLPPDCPVQGLCGGCQFRHADYQEELFAKHQQVESALTRLAHCTLEIPPVLGAKDQDRYRNKVQFPLAPGKAEKAGETGEVKIGFYRPRSHQVLDITDCLLQPESANKARTILKTWMATHQIPAYDEATGRGSLRHLFLRSNQKGESLICLVTTTTNLPGLDQLQQAFQEGLPGLQGLLLNLNKEDTNVVLGPTFHCLWGKDYLYETLSGLEFKLSAPSFFQVNQAQTEVLYQVVAHFAQLQGTETVLDLYCGIGTITLMLAKSAKKVIGNEISPQAISNAQENALHNGFDNVEFFQGDCGQVVSSFLEREIQPQLIVLDPPRKGLAPDVPELLARLEPGRIIYVSCDPATLGRDMKVLADLGYVCKKVQPVDLFPRTRHVETVVLLEKT